MRGHAPIVHMRTKMRQKPRLVLVNVDSARDWLADHWHEIEGMSANVLIEAGDLIDRLDLRFLVGVPLVSVTGYAENRDRVMRAFEACRRAGPDRVIGAVYRPKGEGLEEMEYFDTAGVLTWQP